MSIDKKKVKELIEMKIGLDNEAKNLRQRMDNFNTQVKEVTGHDKLNYDELVLLLCKEDENE